MFRKGKSVVEGDPKRMGLERRRELNIRGGGTGG